MGELLKPLCPSVMQVYINKQKPTYKVNFATIE